MSRTLITLAEIQPGDLIDQWGIGVPQYWRIDTIRDALGAQNTWRHHAIDVGGMVTRHTVALISRRVRRLQRYVARHGSHLTATLRRDGCTMCADVQVISADHDHIIGEVCVTGGVSARVGGTWVSPRADVIWRRMLAHRDARRRDAVAA